MRSSSTSTSVGSEDRNVESNCALSVREKLMDKLTEKENETVELRKKELNLQNQVSTSAHEAHDLRTKLAFTQSTYQEIHEELLRVRAERDELVEAAASQRAEIAGMKGHMKGLLEELSAARDLLETKTIEVCRLQQERSQMENAQLELEKARGLLVAKVEEACRVALEKRALEVTLNTFRSTMDSGDCQQLAKIAELEVSVDTLTRQIECQQRELGTQQGTSEELLTLNRTLTEQLRVSETQRIELHNALQELRGNIRVYCRVRPAVEGSELALDLIDDKMFLNCGVDVHNFTFDKVFGPETEQVEVFQEVEGLVQSALDGFKVCIFAYGQTGSGKTFTMQGIDEPRSQGLIPRSLFNIFKAAEDMRSKGWQWSVDASMMEVYNETLRDLLRSGDPGPECHVIAHQEDWGVAVTGMTRVAVESVEQIEVLTAKAAKQRSVAATDMNATSSRSHSVFTLYLRGTSTILNKEVYGSLSLVDLAGSERLDKSGATGDRLTETRNINRSLSSLADVFRAKAQGLKHVPFRNSKLTHLMEPCLSGQGKTLMLVNVQAEQENAAETLCSLRFAKQVSQCTTGGRVKRNVKILQQPRPPAACSSKPAAPLPEVELKEKSRSLTPRGRLSKRGEREKYEKPLPQTSTLVGPGGRGGRQVAWMSQRRPSGRTTL